MSAQNPSDFSDSSSTPGSSSAPGSSEPITADIVENTDDVIDASMADSETDLLDAPDAFAEQKRAEERTNREECALYMKRIEWFALEMASEEPRKLTWPLILAQLFQPLEIITVLLWSSVVLLSFLVPLLFDVLYRGIGDSPLVSVLVLFLCLYAVLVFFLFYRFLYGIQTLRFLKRGKAAMGHFFQVVEVKYAGIITRQRIRYAYKADNGMIYTTALEDSDYREYASVPALSIFYLSDKPSEGRIYEKMYGLISYSTNQRLFFQSRWYWLSLGLPALPFLALAIGLAVQRFFF